MKERIPRPKMGALPREAYSGRAPAPPSNQFVTFNLNVEWSNLDYLVIDFPPGTGDTQLTILQKIKIDHSLIVTTPQEVALADTRKGINMFKSFNIPINGIVENMSYYICDNCDKKHFLFGESGGEKLSKEFNVKLLGKIPLSKIISNSGDEGDPSLIEKNEMLRDIYEKISINLIN